MKTQIKTSFPIITLSTDFGLEDPYVGVMKGVMLGINPRALLVDLTHSLSHHGLLEAAYVLHINYPYFPPGTIHLAVVDPGVGGGRRLLTIQDRDDFWVGPDNGILSLVLKNHPEAEVFQLVNTDYFLTPLSRTFHGRDIMAPAAAHLSLGIPASEMGRKITDPVMLDFPEPRIFGNGMIGQVLWADHFGNLITNISQKMISNLNRSSELRITVGRLAIAGVRQTYSQVPPGQFLALIGSMGYLEIACNLGRASDLLGFKEGEGMKVEVWVG
jgi:hypothetical protein